MNPGMLIGLFVGASLSALLLARKARGGDPGSLLDIVVEHNT
jgi:hypothetical protein